MHLRINSSYPQVKIGCQLPRIQIQQQLGHFEYQYEGPRIYIDQRQPRNELGMGDLDHFRRTVSLAGRQAALERIARWAREGDRFAREMTTQNTVARLAKERSFEEIPDINVDSMPKTRPKITTIYDLEIRWIDGDTDIEFMISKPRIELVKGKVEVSLDKGSKLDLKG